MRTRRLAGWSLVIGVLAVGSVSPAQDEVLIDRGAPGLLLSFYELEQSPQFMPELAAGQLPNLTRIVRTLDLDSNRGDFAAVNSPFLTEVTGYIHTTSPANYAFRLISDDGARLWIDDHLVIDHDGLHGPEPKDGTVDLTAGTHKLRISHFDAGGGQRLALLWKPPDAEDYAAVPAGALTHDAGAVSKSAAGKKRIIPPLRRGLPGDGTPVARTHPSFQPPSAAGQSATRSEPVRDGQFVRLPAPVWVPDCLAVGPVSPTYPIALDRDGDQAASQLQVSSDSGEWKRIFVDEYGEIRQGCVFRFSAPSGPAFSKHEGTVFEMLGVRAMSNGFEIEFTKPLDARCGWEPDSYVVEQWPFVFAEGRGPRRDGSSTPVKSASVSPDRRKVFLEVEGLQPASVVYIRLLPPCFAEDGQRPWSTEAWYTLSRLPQDRTGQVLPPPTKAPQNILTDAERQAGWKLLFDGKTPAGWHGWKKSEFPAGWEVIDGCLVRTGRGGDIVTDEEFENFELALEWRISPGGNSGIFFRADESLRWAWETAPEMQVLDNAEHADGRSPLTSAGSNYALHAPTRDVTRPVGLFNEVRILVNGAHVEHWLNGEKIVEYELGSPQWQELVAASKFKDMPKYGRTAKGRIVLQDHGDKVWYRNIKIRQLP